MIRHTHVSQRWAICLLANALIVHASAAQDSVPARSNPDSLKSYVLPPVTVNGRADNLIGTATTASEGSVGSADIQARPLTREGELQETIPGVIVTQHSGDGKANQYFARGFNLDHGTDFETSLEGMPLNMPTHAHGQGYTDLNFLIPELVDHIAYKLGNYYPDVGDFGSAGAASYSLVRTLERPFVTASGGANGMARLAAAASFHLADGNLLLGGEAKEYNGPWVLPEELRKLSGVVRYSVLRGSHDFSILAMAYHNQWNASDQIPLRAVTAGLISRFGQIDSTDAGNTARYSLSATWHHTGARATQDVGLYAMHSTLSLFSDFEYALTDTTHGDQFNQRESRVTLGGHATHAQQLVMFGASHVVTAGVQTRYDLLSPVGLYHTEARIRLATIREDDVTESGSGVFLQAESRWRSWFRTLVGLRGDLYTFDVTSDLPENSGHRTAGIVSPKGSLVFTPSSSVEFYLSGGLGFHSNDARGTTITIDPSTELPVAPVDPLVRSHGAEFGVRVNPLASWRSTLSLWVLNLDSELLFTGDGGTTEAAAASHRRGVTWTNFWHPVAALSLDADVSLAYARFTGVPVDQNHIPGALENVVSAGVTWSPLAGRAFGAIRLRHFGSYPLLEDNSVRAMPADLVNADVGYGVGPVRIQLSVLNIFNEVADDIEYYYLSRLTGEPVTGIDDIHFHPVEPRQVRVSLEWRI